MSALNPKLLRAALLGTERAPLPVLGDHPALAGMAVVADPAQNVLRAAAAMTLWSAVGQNPARVVPWSGDVAPPDAGARAPTAFADCLIQLFEQTLLKPLLGEWLRLAARAGYEVPTAALASVLGLGKNRPLLRRQVAEVIGVRGRWLAAKYPEWYYAAVDWRDVRGSNAVWASGHPFARQTLFEQWRLYDPKKGLTALTRSWPSELITNRNKLLRQMRAGLSMADVPLLQRALGDKSRAVRLGAAELLLSLPDTAFSLSVSAEAMTRFRWRGGELKLDIGRGAQAALHDSLVLPGSARRGLGNERWYMLQLFAGAWLTGWEEEWDATPDEIIGAVLRHNEKQWLIRGLGFAAFRQKNEAWLSALVRLGQTHSFARSHTMRLLRSLPPRQVEAILLPMLVSFEKARPSEGPVLPLTQLLFYHSPVWSQALTLAALPLLRHEVQRQGATARPGHSLITHLYTLVRAMNPDLYPQVAEQLQTIRGLSAHWQRVLNRVLQTLAFRRQMYQSLRAPKLPSAAKNERRRKP